MDPKRWTVDEYAGVNGPDYWVTFDGKVMFETTNLTNAEWLADLFNRLGTVPPSERK